jgi:hypothetical protein
METKEVTPLLSGRTYDIFVWAVKIVLPAFGTFYFAISSIWGIAGGEKVIGTISALCLFLGIILQISNKSYDASGVKYQGDLVVKTDPETGAETQSLSLNAPFSVLAQSGDITLKVVKQ